MTRNQAASVRHNSLGWRIQRVAGRLDRAMEARLSGMGLNLQQFAVIMTVLETEGQTQTEIGKRFGMPAYAISRALDALERMGFVERRAHPTSRRKHTVHATAAGQALGPALFRIIAEVNEDLTRSLTPREREAIHAILGKLL